jgi:PE family
LCHGEIRQVVKKVVSPGGNQEHPLPVAPSARDFGRQAALSRCDEVTAGGVFVVVGSQLLGDYSRSVNGDVCRCYAPPMPYVIAAPEMMTVMAADLAGIGSTLSDAHISAATPTVGLVPAAADEVSAGVAHLFSRYAEDFHALSGRASVFHGQFVQNVKASAASYTSTEDDLVALLRTIQRDLTIHFPVGQSPAELLVNLLEALVVGVLFFGLIGVAILGLLLVSPLIALRTLQGALGLPVPPWPLP